MLVFVAAETSGPDGASPRSICMADATTGGLEAEGGGGAGDADGADGVNGADGTDGASATAKDRERRCWPETRWWTSPLHSERVRWCGGREKVSAGLSYAAVDGEVGAPRSAKASAEADDIRFAPAGWSNSPGSACRQTFTRDLPEDRDKGRATSANSAETDGGGATSIAGAGGGAAGLAVAFGTCPETSLCSEPGANTGAAQGTTAGSDMSPAEGAAMGGQGGGPISA